MLTVDLIRKKVIPIAEKYKVRKLGLFGSYANETATEKSDFDFLVEFITPVPSIFAVMGFREELSRELNNPVDVVTLPLQNPEALRIGKVITLYDRP